MSSALYQLTPPYRAFSAAALGDPTPQLGAIYALALLSSTLDLEELERRIVEIRRAAPGCPVVLWTPTEGLEVLPLLVPLVGHCAVRGLVVGQSTTFLREQLTGRLSLASCIARWTMDVTDMRDRRLAADLHALLHEATHHATAGLSVQHIGGAERSWRARFHAGGLPSPGQWVHMIHCLLPALALQRDPERTVADVADEFGVYDASRLASRLRATFQRSPTRIRQLLGFEPLLDTWLKERRGRDAPRPCTNRQRTAGIRSCAVHAVDTT
jgi:AraC-like DNA-binding protein